MVISCVLFALLILFYYREDDDFKFLDRRKDDLYRMDKIILRPKVQGKGSTDFCAEILRAFPVLIYRNF